MQQVVWPQIASESERAALTVEERRLVEDTLTGTVARGLKERICRRMEAPASEQGERAAGASELRETFALEPRFTVGSLTRQTPTQFTMTASQFARVMEPFVEVSGRESDESALNDADRSLLTPVLRILKKAGLRPDALDVLVLHGGSSLNPFVKKMLSDAIGGGGHLLGQLEIVRTPDPMASVARGAALSSYWRHARGVDIVRPIVADDLGILVMGGDARRLVNAGQSLPYPDDEGVHNVSAGQEEFVVPGDDLPELLVPVYTGSSEDPKLAGTVKVPVPAGVAAGTPVQIKLRITREKALEWWFSIGGSAFERAESVDDPWVTAALGPACNRLLDHRRTMRTIVDGGGDVTWSSRLEEAGLLTKAGRLDESLEQVEDMLAEQPGSGAVLNLKGLALAYSGTGEESLAAFQAAAAAQPTSAVALGNAGFKLADLGRSSEAVGAMRRALSINPNLGYLHKRLARIYQDEGNEEAAERELRRAVMLAQRQVDAAPFDREAWFAVAQLRMMLGEYDLADAAHRAAMELTLDNLFGGDSGAIIGSRFGKTSWHDEK
jgi:Flp pilus assembly protein TadD